MKGEYQRKACSLVAQTISITTGSNPEVLKKTSGVQYIHTIVKFISYNCWTTNTTNWKKRINMGDNFFMTFLLLCYLVRIIKQFSFCSDEIAGRHNLYLCYLTTEYMLYIYCIIYLFFVKILHSKWSISEIAKFRSMLSSKPIQLQLCQFSYSYANSATAMPSLASAMPSRSYSTSVL